MPRYYNEVNEPCDFCMDCWPEARRAAIKSGIKDLAVYGDDHPPFEDTDYTCEQPGCRKPLTEEDN